MTSWFTENSIFPLITGVLLTIVLVGLAFSSREKVMLYIAIVIALLTAGVVTCEQLIVTDKEEVTDVIYQLADAVQANDKATVMSFVSDSREDTLSKVDNEMPRYDFNSCRIIGVNHFVPEESGSQKTAEICFVVTVRVNIDNNPTEAWGHRKITLQMEQESDGKWKITDYSHEAPSSGATL
ncbi:MAG: hypothetical protein AB8B55_11735 [Mariniblastus sp.]